MAQPHCVVDVKAANDIRCHCGVAKLTQRRAIQCCIVRQELADCVDFELQLQRRRIELGLIAEPPVDLAAQGLHECCVSIWTRRANNFDTPQTPVSLASNLHPKPVTMTFAMLRWTSGLNKTRRCHSPLPEDGARINFNSTSARRHFKDAPQKTAGQQEWTLEAQTHLNHGLETIGWRTF